MQSMLQMLDHGYCTSQMLLLVSSTTIAYVCGHVCGFGILDQQSLEVLAKCSVTGTASSLVMHHHISVHCCTMGPCQA